MLGIILHALTRGRREDANREFAERVKKLRTPSPTPPPETNEEA